jgi:hypothetical protein
MQPFEIVKIRLVNQSKIKPDYLGIFDCVKKIIKSDGVSGFYKGNSVVI